MSEKLSDSATGPSRPMPTSRWRQSQTTGARGAANRVARSHQQTRYTVGPAVLFIVFAAIAALITDTTWAPLHLFLAGGMILSISGVSLMLTVTWSAAPAPSDRIVMAQRLCVAIGISGVVLGRQLEWGFAVIAASGAVYGVGLVMLAALLITTIRQGVERRFDPAVVAYVAAIAAGIVGVSLGVWMTAPNQWIPPQSAHVAINTLGLIGLVVVGTLPFFASTVGRSRMAPHATARRITTVVISQAVWISLAVIGLLADIRLLATAGLGAYALGIVAVLSLTPRPTRRHWKWAGPRLGGLWLGTLWWAASVAGLAIGAYGNAAVLSYRWLAAMVVAGYAQILWGSFAYLFPMLRGGGPESLSQGFAITRSWVGLAMANVAGISILAGHTLITATAITLWVTDTAVRIARVGVGGLIRRPIPPREPAPQSPRTSEGLP